MKLSHSFLRAVSQSEKSLPESLRLIYKNNTNHTIGENFAGNRSTPPDVLHSMAVSSSRDFPTSVHVKLADNPNSDEHTLREVSNKVGSFRGVGEALAEHPNAPEDVHMRLLGTRDEVITDALEKHSRYPSVHKKMIDSGYYSPSRILYNLHLGAEHIDHIVKTINSGYTNLAASHHPNTDPKTLDHIVDNDKSVSTRHLIARRINTSPETLHKIATDPETPKHDVRLVKNHRNTSKKTKAWIAEHRPDA